MSKPKEMFRTGIFPQSLDMSAAVEGRQPGLSKDRLPEIHIIPEIIIPLVRILRKHIQPRGVYITAALECELRRNNIINPVLGGGVLMPDAALEAFIVTGHCTAVSGKGENFPLTHAICINIMPLCYMAESIVEQVIRCEIARLVTSLTSVVLQFDPHGYDYGYNITGSLDLLFAPGMKLYYGNAEKHIWWKGGCHNDRTK